MSEDFSGRVALITGAGKGLGRAYALWLARRGCAVIVNNRSHPGVPSSAKAVVEEIAGFGGRAVADEHPVEDEAGAEAMIDLAISAFGKIDILICNAGISTRTPFGETTIADMRRVIDINWWGSVIPAHAAFRHMLKQRYGRIVLTGSSAGLYGHAGSAAYGATKAGMIGFARCVMQDVPEDADIRINIIAPFAYTPMSSDQIDAAFADHLSPDRVAPAAGWLASEACNEGGMVLHAGGGRVARVRLLETRSVGLDVIGNDQWKATLMAPVTPEEPSNAEMSSGRVAST